MLSGTFWGPAATFDELFYRLQDKIYNTDKWKLHNNDKCRPHGGDISELTIEIM